VLPYDIVLEVSRPDDVHDALCLGDVVVVRSKDMTMTEENASSVLSECMNMVTRLVVRWIEHNRIPGELVFHYELKQLGWNFKVVCIACKRVRRDVWTPRTLTWCARHGHYGRQYRRCRQDSGSGNLSRP